MEPAAFSRFRLRYAEEYLTAPRLNTLYIAFDCRRPPFDNAAVRKALALAIDRERLADVVLGGLHFPATGGFVPPGMPGHVEGIALPYDPERARRLLAQSGYPEGDDFSTVEFLCYDAFMDLQFPGFLQQQWLGNLGIQIAWQALPWGEFLNRVSDEEQRPHLWPLGSVADYPDPDTFLRAAGGESGTGWRHEHYEQLIQEARSLTDQRRRMVLYEQAQRILVDEAPVIPCVYLRDHTLLKPWVKRFPTSPIQSWFLKDVILEPH